MKAVVMESYGMPDVLQLRDVVKPTPKAGEVLVRVHAASVNDWDWAMMQGAPLIVRMFNDLFTPKVQIIGCDMAGRVETVGGAVKTFQPGDEVHGDLCRSGFGAFAEYAYAPEATLAWKPARMAERNGGVAPERRIEFRVGINVGDIILDGEDIYGDGVNVAARLQALAEPGEICVNKVVRDQVLDKLSFAFEDLGAQQVKNIARPVEVYRILDDPPAATERPRSNSDSVIRSLQAMYQIGSLG